QARTRHRLRQLLPRVGAIEAAHACLRQYLGRHQPRIHAHAVMVGLDGEPMGDAAADFAAVKYEHLVAPNIGIGGAFGRETHALWRIVRPQHAGAAADGAVAAGHLAELGVDFELDGSAMTRRFDRAHLVPPYAPVRSLKNWITRRSVWRVMLLGSLSRRFSVSTECGPKPGAGSACSSSSSMASNLSPNASLNDWKRSLVTTGSPLKRKPRQERSSSMKRFLAWAISSGESPVAALAAALKPSGSDGCERTGATTAGSVIIASAKLPVKHMPTAPTPLPPHSACTLRARARSQSTIGLERSCAQTLNSRRMQRPFSISPMA